MSEINPWKTLKKKHIYDNPWISVDEHDIITPANTEGIYGIVHFKNLAVGVIPIDDEGNTYIVGQYRYPLKKYTWEIIEGGGNLEVDPIISAQRELLEEAGIKAQKWEKILEMDLSNSATDEHAIIYVAKDLSHHESEPEETEDLQLKKITLEELIEKVYSGEIDDSLSVAGVLKLKLMIEKGDLKI